MSDLVINNTNVITRPPGRPAPPPPPRTNAQLVFDYMARFEPAYAAAHNYDSVQSALGVIRIACQDDFLVDPMENRALSAGMRIWLRAGGRELPEAIDAYEDAGFTLEPDILRDPGVYQRDTNPRRLWDAVFGKEKGLRLGAQSAEALVSLALADDRVVDPKEVTAVNRALARWIGQGGSIGRAFVDALERGGIALEPALKVMKEQDFLQLLSAIRARSFDDDRLQVVRSRTGDTYLDVEQIAYLMDAMTFDEGKVGVVRALVGSIADRSNAWRLIEHATFESGRAAVRRILEGAGIPRPGP